MDLRLISNLWNHILQSLVAVLEQKKVKKGQMGSESEIETEGVRERKCVHEEEFSENEKMEGGEVFTEFSFLSFSKAWVVLQSFF